jgi:hypothetical protein
LLGHRRGTVGWVDECRIAAPTAAPSHGFDPLTRLDQVGDHHTFLVEDDRTQRDHHREIIASTAVTEVALAMGAVTGGVMGVPLVAEQGCH